MNHLFLKTDVRHLVYDVMMCAADDCSIGLKHRFSTLAWSIKNLCGSRIAAFVLNIFIGKS